MSEITFNNLADRVAFWQALGKPDQEAPPTEHDLSDFAERASPDHYLYRDVLASLAHELIPGLRLGGQPIGSPIGHTKPPQSLLSVAELLSDDGLDTILGGRKALPFDEKAALDWMMALPIAQETVRTGEEGSPIGRCVISYAGLDLVMVMTIDVKSGLSFAVYPMDGSIKPDTRLKELPFKPITKLTSKHYGFRHENGDIFLFYMSQTMEPRILQIARRGGNRLEISDVIVGQIKPPPHYERTLDEMIATIEESQHTVDNPDEPYDADAIFASLTGYPAGPEIQTWDYGEGEEKVRYTLRGLNQNALAVLRIDFGKRKVSVTFLGQSERRELVSMLNGEGMEVRKQLEKMIYYPIRSDHRKYAHVLDPLYGVIVVSQAKSRDGKPIPRFFMGTGNVRVNELLGDELDNFVTQIMIPQIKRRGARTSSALQLRNWLMSKRGGVHAQIIDVSDKGHRFRYMLCMDDEMIGIVRVTDGKSVDLAFMTHKEFGEMKARLGNEVYNEFNFHPLTLIAEGFWGIKHPDLGTIIHFSVDNGNPAFMIEKVIRDSVVEKIVGKENLPTPFSRAWVDKLAREEHPSVFKIRAGKEILTFVYLNKIAGPDGIKGMIMVMRDGTMGFVPLDPAINGSLISEIEAQLLKNGQHITNPSLMSSIQRLRTIPMNQNTLKGRSPSTSSQALHGQLQVEAEGDELRVVLEPAEKGKPVKTWRFTSHPLFSREWFEALQVEDMPGAFLLNGRKFVFLKSTKNNGWVVITMGPRGLPLFAIQSEKSESFEREGFKPLFQAIEATVNGPKMVEGFPESRGGIFSTGEDRTYHLYLRAGPDSDLEMYFEFVEFDPQEKEFEASNVKVSIFPHGARIRVFGGEKAATIFLGFPIPERKTPVLSAQAPTSPPAPAAPRPDPAVTVAITNFNNLRPALEFPIEIGNKTRLRTFFRASSAPIPLWMKIDAPNGVNTFGEVRDMGEIKVPISAEIRWGSEDSTPMKYTLTGKKGSYVLEPVNGALGALGGRITFIDDTIRGRKVLVLEKGSELWWWLDGGIYGPVLVMKEEKNGDVKSVVMSGDRDAALISTIDRMFSQNPDLTAEIDIKWGEEAGFLKITYAPGKEKQVAALIDKIAEIYRQSLGQKGEVIWKTEVPPPEPVERAKRATRNIKLPESVDRSEGNNFVQVSIERRSLAGKTTGMAIAIAIRGKHFEFEDSNPATFSATIKVQRLTTDPPGEERFDLVIGEDSSVTLQNYQFFLKTAEGLQPVGIEPFELEVALNKDFGRTTSSPLAEFYGTHFRAPTGEVLLTRIERMRIRGEMDPIKLPLNLGKASLPHSLTIVRDEVDRRGRGWEIIRITISDKGVISVASDEFILEEDRSRYVREVIDDLFEVGLKTLDTPHQGLQVTSLELYLTEPASWALGLIERWPAKNLPVEFERGMKFQFDLGIIKVQLSLERQPDGSFKIIRSPVEPIPVAWDLETGKSPVLGGFIGNEARSLPSIPLELISSVNGIRYRIPRTMQEKVLAVLTLSGTNVGYDPSIHSALEVAQGRDGPIFEPVSEKFGQVVVRHVKWNSKSSPGLPEAYLQIPEGESFVPTATTLKMIQQSFKADRVNSSFTEGSLYWYELQGVLSHIVLRIPVQWRPDRPTNPFEIDNSQPVYAMIAGSNPSEGVKLRSSRLQVHDNGGNWSIYYLGNESLPGRLKTFELSAVVSRISPVIIALANVIDKKGLEADRELYRKDAERERDRAVIEYTRETGLPERKLFAKPHVTYDEDGGAVFHFSKVSSEATADLKTAVLKGLRIDAENSQLLLSETLTLTLGDQTLELVALENSSLQPGNLYLVEIRDGQKTGISFVWNLALGLLSKVEERPSFYYEPDRMPLLLSTHGFPVRPQSERSFSGPAIKPANFMPVAEKADRRVPILPMEHQGYLYPEPSQLHLVEGAGAVADFASLTGQTFVPAEESVYAMLTTGRALETMTFISPSGAILQIPMQMVSDGAGRYKADVTAVSAALWARLILPHPELKGHFISLKAMITQRRKGGGTRLELLVGPKQIPLILERGGTSQTFNGRPVFGFFAVYGEPGRTIHGGEGEEVEFDRARISSRLREWIEFLELDNQATSLQVSTAQNRLQVKNEDDEWEIFLSQKSGSPSELDGLQFDGESGESQPYVLYHKADKSGRMAIFRAPGGGSLYYLVDEEEKILVLAIGDDGQIRIWERKPGVRQFHSALESRDFEMVGLKGERYKSKATSVAIRNKLSGNGDAEGTDFEIRAVLGRSEGASESSLVYDGSNPRLRIRFTIVGENIYVHPVGEIKEEGKNKKWHEADVECETRDGKVRIFVRGKNFRPGNYRDYAWIEFDSLEDLRGENFRIALAHYNRTHIAASQLMPSEVAAFQAFPEAPRTGRRRTPLRGTEAGVVRAPNGTRGPKDAGGGNGNGDGNGNRGDGPGTAKALVGGAEIMMIHQGPEMGNDSLVDGGMVYGNLALKSDPVFQPEPRPRPKLRLVSNSETSGVRLVGSESVEDVTEDSSRRQKGKQKGAGHARKPIILRSASSVGSPLFRPLLVK